MRRFQDFKTNFLLRLWGLLWVHISFEIRVCSKFHGEPLRISGIYTLCYLANFRLMISFQLQSFQLSFSGWRLPKIRNSLKSLFTQNKQNDSASEMERNFAAKIQTSKQTRAVSSDVDVSDPSPSTSPQVIQTSHNNLEMNYNQNVPYKRPVRSTRNPRPQYIDSITY